jgi:hypothetical protein
MPRVMICKCEWNIAITVNTSIFIVFF